MSPSTRCRSFRTRVFPVKHLHCQPSNYLTEQPSGRTHTNTKQAVGGRPPRYLPAPLLPPGAPKRHVPSRRRQRSSSFPRSHAQRCSRLTRQHGGAQSGLVTLTFDLLTLKMVSESRVTWATSVPILVFLCLSVLDLGPMYATDRRQTASSLYAPVYQGRGIITQHNMWP